MTDAAGPAYLGGIGLMIEVARACPRCGKRLSESPSAANRHLAGRGCRPPVFAALPEPEAVSEDEEVPPVSAGRRIHDFETPLVANRSERRGRSPPPSITVPMATGPSRGFAVAWLRPPDLGEVL